MKRTLLSLLAIASCITLDAASFQGIQVVDREYVCLLGEPLEGGLTPRQPQFIPGKDPKGFKVYLSELHPWHPEWRKLRGDVWDEPHFKNGNASAFWRLRPEGNRVNDKVIGGHSDAMDWDRHLAHVSNIYDLLLPYLLTGGRLGEDDLGIRESGNGIPDLLDEARWITSENLQLVMLAHYASTDEAWRKRLERAMYLEAGWGLGRNPGNIVEMTGLGQRHITDCYSSGRNDGLPGTHPGQTPFNGTETWSEGDGGDARIILRRCYPDWWNGGWPRQESYFNQRYFWVNGEFTPRETMRGKAALLAYLYGIRLEGR